MGIVHELMRGFRAWHGTAIDIKWEKEQGAITRQKWQGLGLKLKKDADFWAADSELVAEKEHEYETKLAVSNGAHDK